MERSITPIDFRKLLREEKKRARENRKNKQQQVVENDPSESKTGGRASEDFSETVTICTPRTLPAWEPSAQHSWNVPMVDRCEHCVCSNPESIYYLPSFVPPQLGRDIWVWLQKLPLVTASETHSSSSGEPTPGCWHVLPHAKRKVALFHNKKNAPFSPPLQILVDALIQGGVFPAQESTNSNNQSDGPPNHILVNEYSPEQGILPHTDGPAYNSRTATISLGQGDVLLNFVPRPEHHQQNHQSSSTSISTALSTMPSPQLLLHGGGSLVVFENAAYLDYMHSIAEVNEGSESSSPDCLNAPAGTLVQRQPRISLTVRRKHYEE